MLWSLSLGWFLTFGWAAETVSTLKFAHRAKSVRNTAHVNEDADQRTLLRKYEQELRKLRAELQMRQREVVDKRHLLAVSLPNFTSTKLQDISAQGACEKDAPRARSLHASSSCRQTWQNTEGAEALKLAAIMALGQRSREVVRWCHNHH